MRTAIDSSVLLDVFQGDPRFGAASRTALRIAYDSGALIVCEVVWAEVRAHFPTDEAFTQALDLLGVRFDPIHPEASATAGRLWRQSRKGAKKSPRKRVVADFLVGAHALHQSDALLTRDQGFYRRHFHGLKVVTPRESASPGR